MYLIAPNFSDLMEPNIEFKTFPDGDSYVRINVIDKCQGEDVTLFHRLYPKQNTAIFNATQILHTLKRVGARVTLVSPYLPYSRQDKTFLMGESLSAQVLCKLLNDFGTVKLVTVDCHFLKKEGESEYSNLKIQNISANKMLVEHARKKVGLEPLEIISPDQGANYLISEFGGKSMSKVRGQYDSTSGEEAYRSVQKVEREFDVEGKTILILDDMISTGGTMIKAVENVKKGGAKKVFCAATHGFFLNDSLDKLRKISDGVFTTNSIPNPVAEVDLLPLLKGPF
ncbi:Ribose-phosphate pyrophosphokinase [Candidatus Bilamarchaeum dharawalense]|uniref:ribose-phosphate diphosphokinase n=1 Tax=Candidatus Bilamarchaeum dharawalense TaxID=2885759 RepID=A0A5E4LPH6_9ARCH|nr:Ribose-phosphate pyrophosphokinase [Candidatus Bilamarchaeum dharawalense]